MVFYPSFPSSRAPNNVTFQVHNAIDRLVTRKPSRSFEARITVLRPKYLRPFIVVFIITVEGGLQGGGDRVGSIFDVCLSRVLWGLREGPSGLRFVQGFIRDLC